MEIVKLIVDGFHWLSYHVQSTTVSIHGEIHSEVDLFSVVISVLWNWHQKWVLTKSVMLHSSTLSLCHIFELKFCHFSISVVIIAVYFQMKPFQGNLHRHQYILNFVLRHLTMDHKPPNRRLKVNHQNRMRSSNISQNSAVKTIRRVDVQQRQFVGRNFHWEHQQKNVGRNMQNTILLLNDSRRCWLK